MNNCAIIIPVYQEITSQDELFSFKHTLKVFQKREVHLVTPKKLDYYAKKLQRAHPELRINTFEDHYFKSVKQYNRLLTSISFYKRFKSFSHICICQLDVLSLNDDLDYWMRQNWDYVGAPLFHGYGKSNSFSFKTTLNGGFSLRKVDSAINVLRSIRFRFSKLKNLYQMEDSAFLKTVRIIRDGLVFNYNVPLFKTKLNEDLFWTYIVPREHSSFKIPAPDIAQNFAFDMHPKWLFERNGNHFPLAIHAWKRFDPEFTKEIYKQLFENH